MILPPLFLLLLSCGVVHADRVVKVSQSPPKEAGRPWPDFVSYSIELSSLFDFAGNVSAPNTYSLNLLENIARFTGTKSVIRVGGATQDRTIFDVNQKEGYIGTIIPAISPDFPGRITIGPSFFESYQTWPGYTFTHGLNYGNLAVLNATLASIPYACRSIPSLLAFEYGNEPDLYILFRLRNTSTWNDATYVSEWTRTLQQVQTVARSSCPRQFRESLSLYGPTFAGLFPGDLNNLTALSPSNSWSLGLFHSPITYLATHNYMNVASAPGITLQNTLMNHTAIRALVSDQVAFHAALSPTPPPLVLGEHNSLAQQGRPGLSDTFGAALWGLTFNAAAAAQGIKRQHMHQGTNYRYQLWQPVDTNFSARATKPAYYGNVALAAFLGRIKEGDTRVADLGLQGDTGAAYGVWEKGRLGRVLLVDLREWNGTTEGSQGRKKGRYVLQLERGARCEGRVRRLEAVGADARDGVTFDGVSYDFEKKQGRPVRVKRETIEKARTDKGQLVVDVPWSSAVVMDC
ncbi:Beta-glucuronidase-like protein [Elsinoe fawcettii]|nr:Beta-glucuronidase-like protein [Elsinoe fawcettii]